MTLFQEEPAQPARAADMLAAAHRLPDKCSKAGEEPPAEASGRAPDRPTKRLLKSFDDRVRADLAHVRSACGYEPAYFTGRVLAAGAREAVRELLADEDARFNWRRLAKSSLLHMSPAASVLDPDFSGIFSRQELAEARKRLQAIEPVTDDVAAVLREAAGA
jgi:hypothetical protein